MTITNPYYRIYSVQLKYQTHIINRPVSFLIFLSVNISFDFETSVNHRRDIQKTDFEMIERSFRVCNFYTTFLL